MLILCVKVLLFLTLLTVPPMILGETFNGFIGLVDLLGLVLDIQNLLNGGRLSTLFGRIKYDPLPLPPPLLLKRRSMLVGRSLR